jgi:hypothetical protein
MKTLPRFRKLTALARFALPALMLSLFATSPAFAGSLRSSDTFYGLVQTLLSWIDGHGIALALSSVLIGTGVAVVRNSQLAMMIGIAIAVLLHPPSILSVHAPAHDPHVLGLASQRSALPLDEPRRATAERRGRRAPGSPGAGVEAVGAARASGAGGECRGDSPAAQRPPDGTDVGASGTRGASAMLSRDPPVTKR